MTTEITQIKNSIPISAFKNIHITVIQNTKTVIISNANMRLFIINVLPDGCQKP